MLHVVIMAGGVGTRFWPRSRALMPKQLLNIVGERTMIEQTFGRVRSLVPPERILIVTNETQAEAVSRQLPEIPKANILIEPVGRNTAPCIGLAALHIQKKDPEGVMAVLAADHLIQPEGDFCRVIRSAAEVAEKTKAVVTLGIVPTRPETGYGYIQFLENEFLEAAGDKAHRVKTFAEKPNLDTAKRFVKAGDFLWNSGMFIWKASVILKLIETFIPDLHDGLSEIAPVIGKSDYDKTLGRVYHTLKGISIDYGVMERTKDVYVIRCQFQWNDVGSWEEVFRLSPKDANGNAVTGKSVCIDSNNSLIYSPDKTVALVGLTDLIVVETGDALLICPRDRAQDVKKIVEELQRQKRSDLL